MSKELLIYLQIDYAPNVTQEHGIPWVVVVVDPASPDRSVRVCEIERNRSLIEPGDREYLDALISDWMETRNRDGGALLDSLTGLTVGPIRAKALAFCTEQQLHMHISALPEDTGGGSNGPPSTRVRA